MNKFLRRLLITVLSVIMACGISVLAVGCTAPDDNNNNNNNADDSFTITVLYPDGTAVNGVTDGTGFNSDTMSETQVKVQFCSVTTDVCATPVNLGADGKVTVAIDDLLGEDNYKVQILGCPTGYSSNGYTVIEEGTYELTITLTPIAE